ncbi:protein LSM14 homolog B [Nematostella vectensis]|nr:protein LSM14 homolog B [Nematostella vectensis]
MTSSIPYIGSIINLVSKAEIRYVGTLYAIDTKESTVTLANVRSFGTEGRKVDVEIPPRNEIYEYIVFRGQDIKDLNVKLESNETSKTVPQPPQDPAILQSSTAGIPGGYSPYRSGPYQPNPGYSPFSGPLMHPSYHMPQPPSFQDHPGPGVMPQMPPQMAPGTPLMPRIPTPPLPQNMGLGLSRTSTPSPELRVSPSPTLKTESTQTKGTTSQQSTQTAKKKPSSRKGSVDKVPEKDGKKPEAETKDEGVTEHQNRKSAGEHRTRGNNRRSQGRRGGSRGPRHDASKEFEGEYDFESANAKFKKEEIEEELQKKLRITDEVEVEGEEVSPQSPTQPQYYNKSTSFFDSISCEANDRDKNRKAHPSWQEERKLNTETFGVSGMRRGRGGYRGRGGRGGYRGRGGGRGYYRGGRGGGRGGGGRGGRGGLRGEASEASPNRDWVDYPLDNDTSKLQKNLPNGPPAVDQSVQA